MERCYTPCRASLDPTFEDTPRTHLPQTKPITVKTIILIINTTHSVSQCIYNTAVPLIEYYSFSKQSYFIISPFLPAHSTSSHTSTMECGTTTTASEYPYTSDRPYSSSLAFSCDPASYSYQPPASSFVGTYILAPCPATLSVNDTNEAYFLHTRAIAITPIAPTAPKHHQTHQLTSDSSTSSS